MLLRNDLAGAAVFEPVLSDKLLITKLFLQTDTLRKRLPGRSASIPGAVIRESNRGDLGPEAADCIIGKGNSVLLSKVLSLPCIQVEIVLFRIPVDWLAGRVQCADQDFGCLDCFGGNVLDFHLRQDFSGLCVFQQITGRNDHRCAFRIQVFRQRIKPPVSFAHGMPP